MTGYVVYKQLISEMQQVKLFSNTCQREDRGEKRKRRGREGDTDILILLLFLQERLAFYFLNMIIAK